GLEAGGDVARLCAVMARLQAVCGLEPDPRPVLDSIRASDRDSALNGEEPEERFLRIARACGLQASRVRLPVRDAVNHARGEHPLATSARTPDGEPQYLVIERHGGSRVRVSGLHPEPVVLPVSGLARHLGRTVDAEHDWVAVQRDLPAATLSGGSPPGGGHGQGPGEGAGAGDGHQSDAHPSPFLRIRALARLERRDLWSLLGYAIVTGLLYLAVPLAADALVSNIAFGGQQRVYRQALLLLGLMLGGFLCLHALVRALAFLLIERLQRRLFVRFTNDLALRLPRVRQAEFDRYHGPELTNRFFDIMTLQKAAAQLLLDGLDVVLTFLVGSLLLAV
ncbi:MAG: hypothetical protein KIT22_20720, partial [Verrucomicrobiae bacterium]|nr:hypothetical protein [Verrucomicrobiae bacterium]